MIIISSNYFLYFLKNLEYLISYIDSRSFQFCTGFSNNQLQNDNYILTKENCCVLEKCD